MSRTTDKKAKRSNPQYYKKIIKRYIQKEVQNLPSDVATNRSVHIRHDFIYRDSSGKEHKVGKWLVDLKYRAKISPLYSVPNRHVDELKQMGLGNFDKLLENRQTEDAIDIRSRKRVKKSEEMSAREAKLKEKIDNIVWDVIDEIAELRKVKGDGYIINIQECLDEEVIEKLKNFRKENKLTPSQLTLLNGASFPWKSDREAAKALCTFLENGSLNIPKNDLEMQNIIERFRKQAEMKTIKPSILQILCKIGFQFDESKKKKRQSKLPTIGNKRSRYVLPCSRRRESVSSSDSEDSLPNIGSPVDQNDLSGLSFDTTSSPEKDDETSQISHNDGDRTSAECSLLRSPTPDSPKESDEECNHAICTNTLLSTSLPILETSNQEKIDEEKIDEEKIDEEQIDNKKTSEEIEMKEKEKEIIKKLIEENDREQLKSMYWKHFGNTAGGKHTSTIGRILLDHFN